MFHVNYRKAKEKLQTISKVLVDMIKQPEIYGLMRKSYKQLGMGECFFSY